jgi:hypothetical protein
MIRLGQRSARWGSPMRDSEKPSGPFLGLIVMSH